MTMSCANYSGKTKICIWQNEVQTCLKGFKDVFVHFFVNAGFFIIYSYFLFRQEGLPHNVKLIKPENLSPYEKTDLIECQYVNPGHPFGRMESRFFPKEHPIFRLDVGNSPVFKRCGFPLVVVRYPYNRSVHPREKYDNQFATYLLIGKNHALKNHFVWQVTIISL